MSEALRRLGEVSRTYEALAQDYARILEEAAHAEADYKRARGRFIVTARFEDPKASVAFIDAQVDADDDLAGLLRQRLVTQSAAEAAKARLQQLREQVANGRTAVATERESDRIHSTSTGVA
jgi:hypothetical protein